MLQAADARFRRSGRWLALLTLCVVAGHLWLVDRSLPSRLGEGAADSTPRRIDVSFVRELVQAPVAITLPARAPKRLATLSAGPAAPAASAAEPSLPIGQGAPDIEPPPELTAALERLPEVALVPDAPAAAVPATLTPQAFEWPPSTRLSYTLTGNYRGPVQGSAQVEWLRSGSRYQVRMDVSAALFFSRRISSEGEITSEGLRPKRYDEETKIVLRDPRSLTILLDGDRVRLPGGSELPRPPGVQDSASQFVQMTWLFTTQPALLRKGQIIEIPLALPRRVEAWVYEVMETETLFTPAGPVEAVHVKPRREGRGNELVAEMWVAPSLQYLPVRLLIRQDAQTYIDMLIERLPQQAEPGR